MSHAIRTAIKLGHMKTPSPYLPQLHVPTLAIAKERAHVGCINGALQDHGIIKLNLGFVDPESDYLKLLLQSFQRLHNHGLPISHSASRGWFWDIQPGKATQHQARSETAKEFPWHTDCSYEEHPPKFFALQVLQADECGGGTLSVLKADSLVQILSAKARESLCMPEYRITVPLEFLKGKEEQIIGSLLSIDAKGSVSIRFREDITTPITTRASHAFQELRDALLGSGVKKHVLHFTSQVLHKESIVLVDNRRWLHARTEVRDPKRHLRRVRWDAREF